MRKTKIIATIGPASEDAAILDALVAAGMDVARLNASHGTDEDIARRFSAVRAAAERGGRHVAVLLDLPGPKLRLGDMAPGTRIEPGATFTLRDDVCLGDATHACVSHHELAGDLSPGDRVLLDDGRVELEVVSTGAGEVRTRVITGGPVGSHKGVNVPGVTLHGLSAVTERDRVLVSWAIEAGVDLLAQSFVRTAEDVVLLRDSLCGGTIPVVAKIEKHEAVSRIDAIIAVADAVMVARGDLGVETSPEDVPVLQRAIVSAARAAGRPVIVATQMLESMVASPRPTRAEASDVASAIFQGVDGVMLSAETAVGTYPVAAVATMARIALTAEASGSVPDVPAAATAEDRRVTEAVSSAACNIAEDVNAAAIVPITQSGATARAVARHRPASPIVAATPDASVARRLSHVWGVRPLVVAFPSGTDALLDAVTVAVGEAGAAAPGERVVLTAGRSTSRSGGTNLLLVREL